MNGLFDNIGLIRNPAHGEGEYKKLSYYTLRRLVQVLYDVDWSLAELVVDNEGGNDGTLTFSATRAKLAGSGGTFATMSSETFEVQLEGLAVQLITMGTETTLQDAVNTINLLKLSMANGKVEVGMGKKGILSIRKDKFTFYIIPAR